MDDLRTRIWDHLYLLGKPQPIGNIAEQINEDSERIQQAVADPWFDLRDGLVTIAVGDK